MQKELDNKYSGKIIYAFYGLGKSTARSMNNRIIETDVILSELFNTRVDNLYDTLKLFQESYPEVKDYKMTTAKNMITNFAQQGATILTSNDELLTKSDYIFVPKDISIIRDRINDPSRTNPFDAELSKLESKLKKIKTIAENNDIPIEEIDGYLSDYLFV